MIRFLLWKHITQVNSHQDQITKGRGKKQKNKKLQQKFLDNLTANHRFKGGVRVRVAFLALHSIKDPPSRTAGLAQ